MAFLDEKSLIKKLNKAKQDKEYEILIDLNKKLGDLYFDQKRNQEALEAYQDQLEASKAVNDELNCAIAYRMIGEVYADIQNYEAALQHQQLYLEFANMLNNLIEEQRAHATLGRTYLLFSESFVKESEEDKKASALKEAKKSFKNSIRVCEQLNGKIDVTELQTMRARLLLNLGLVFEHQKNIDGALNLIKQAETICKKNKIYEDLYRTNISLAGLYDRQGNIELALKKFDDAVECNDDHFRVEAKFLKAEYLLKIGEWSEAKNILFKLYKSKKLVHLVFDGKLLKSQVEKWLKIAVILCKTEDKLLVTDCLSDKEKLFEKMGDTLIAAKSFTKAAEYYREMLRIAEETNSPQIPAALTSLAQTLKDLGKFKEAIPYAQRELELCQDPKEICNSAFFLTNLMIEAKYPQEKIRFMFTRSISAAKDDGDVNLEKNVLKALLDYLKKQDNVNVNEIEELKNQIDMFGESQDEDVYDNECYSPEIGADINLSDLSDQEENEQHRNVGLMNNVAKTSRRNRFIVKKNEKGETQLHSACIKGNIGLVTKLIEDNHPVNVRDNCGWTPLHEAANFGNVDIVKLLIEAGANVNDPGGVGCDGITAMHDAAANGHFSTVQLLLDSGADANLLTKNGDTALDCLKQYKERNDLTGSKLLDYVQIKGRLMKLTKHIKKNKKIERGNSLKALVDDDDDDAENNGITLDEWTEVKKISAGEDYKRTIASMQHPGRLSTSTKPPSVSKITAPLIDSEEMLVDGTEWLEDDIGLNHKKKERFFNPAFTGVQNIKRKSKDNDVVLDDKSCDKIYKKQKISVSLLDQKREPSPVSVLSDSSQSSDEVPSKENWPKSKKPRQTNLLKQGFSRQAISHSPPPHPPAPTYVSIAQERRSWDSITVNETLDLRIDVESFSFELKLHSRDLRKTINDIEELTRHKFELKTGCKPKIRFQTLEGVILEPESTLETVSNGSSRLNLVGQIISNELIPINERYNKVCENLNINVTDRMLKSLRSCDNTQSFRINLGDSYVSDEELDSLVTCLHYQVNLQCLDLSSVTFFGKGKLLDYCISKLQNLCELHLHCCDIDKQCLLSLNKLPIHLRVLDLSYNPLGGFSQEKLYKLLEPLERLQTLNLRSCEIDNFNYSLRSSSLVNLDVSCNPIGGDGAANFLQRHLLSLNLSNTQNNKTNVIDKIFFNESIDFTFFTLVSLELSNVGATDFDVDKILSKTPNLTRINLSNNINVTSNTLGSLLCRKPGMHFINLSGCRQIDSPPESNVKVVVPHLCTVLVNMNQGIVHHWEKLWLGKGVSKKLPCGIFIFKPF